MPTVAPSDSRPLLWPPIGALPRNRLASSATGGASPVSPTPRFTAPLVTPPPGLAPHPMKNHVIAKPVRTLAVAIRTPVPSAPLPKGGWHGKAVTGEFYTSPHLLQPFRRGGVLLPTVVPTDSRPLSCPPIGALPRNRLASSATGSASPISPTARPEFFPHPRQGTRALPCKMLSCRAGPVCPAAHRTPCKKPVIAKPVRTAPVAKRGVGDAAPYEVLSVNGV